MAQRELQRGRLERYAVAFTYPGEVPHPGEHVVRHDLVLVTGLRRGLSEHASVEDAAEDHADAAPCTLRQQFLRATLIEERVAACEQDAVDASVPGEPRQHSGLVHAHADGTDHAVTAQTLQRPVRTVHRLRVVIVRVVNENDVESLQAEPAEAFLDAAHDRVVGEIELGVEGEPPGFDLLPGDLTPFDGQEPLPVLADVDRDDSLAQHADPGEQQADEVHDVLPFGGTAGAEVLFELLEL